jgi:hypothetical protein
MSFLPEAQDALVRLGRHITAIYAGAIDDPSRHAAPFATEASSRTLPAPTDDAAPNRPPAGITSPGWHGKPALDHVYLALAVLGLAGVGWWFMQSVVHGRARAPTFGTAEGRERR